MKRDESISWLTVAANELDLEGWRIAIIGGTGGIGQALARVLARQGARLTVVGRTFRDRDAAGIEFVEADLARMTEAKRIAEELPAEQLDMLIFTAGIMAGPKRQETVEGIERDLAVSYLNRFVIQREMAPRLGRARTDRSGKPRVFNVAFPGTGQVFELGDVNSEQKYGRMVAHSRTVAGNEVLVLDGCRRYPEINFFGLNPGFVKTRIRRNLVASKKLLAVMEWMTSFMTAEPEAYAERLVPLLVSTDIEDHNGAMFNNKAEAIRPSAKSTEAPYAAAVTRASENMIARAGVTL